jgi:hypothetical protein
MKEYGDELFIYAMVLLEEMEEASAMEEVSEDEADKVEEVSV